MTKVLDGRYYQREREIFVLWPEQNQMGRKYSFRDNRQLYFVTFTVVHWIDAFIRAEYRAIVYDSVKYCQTNKGLEVYGYCIMTNHLHMIIGTERGVLPDIVRDFKSYTSRHIRKAIGNNIRESRREWMLSLMYSSGIENQRNRDFQFWQQHNHPIELSTSEMLEQRLAYIHNNPVELRLVEKEEEWVHSSAGDYYGIRKGAIELLFV
jgi:REP element-mobilizing transposase RayT